jgi:hypothetical protein
MKHALIIIFLLTINVVLAQKLAFPKKPYVIVLGKDSLVTRTIIEKAPGLYENYTLENKAVYANVDSLRVWTYLFKDEKYTISFPERMDTVYGIDLSTGGNLTWIDSTDHIDINKLIDSFSAGKLHRLLNTEVKVFYGTQKLKIRRLRVMLVSSTGKTFEYDCAGTKIRNCTLTGNDLKTILPNGYLILNRIWFYDEKNKPNGISQKIAWKTE